MSAQIFEDKSIEAALEQASTALGVPVEELDHELVDERAGDFWGLGETVYSVRAWQRGALPADEAPAAQEAADEGVSEVSGGSESPTEQQQAQPEASTPEAPTAAPEAPSASAEAPSASAEVDQPPADAAPSSPAEAAADTGEETEGLGPADADEAEPAATDQETPEGAAADEGDLPDFFKVSDDEPTDAPSEVHAVATDPQPVVAGAADAPEEAGPEGDETVSARADAGAASAGEKDVSSEAIGLLGTIFEAMGFDCAAEARLEGETLQIAITGDDNQYLLDGRGRGLSALELILNHAFRHRADRAHRRVRVDAGDFRSQRDDEIRDMAYQVAHQAKETNSPQQTGPLNPYERRIVHLTLADDPSVNTRSIGNGFQKAVNVIPTQGGRRR